VRGNSRVRADFPVLQARFLLVMVALIVSLALASCASMPRASFTEKEQNVARIPGMPNVRFFADASLEEVTRVADMNAVLASARKSGRFELLAISGGAWDGAYGAGIVTGWTKSGRRPKFTVVTGVSAGALIAPFAFIGPDYDAALKDAFTSGASAPIGDGSDNLLAMGAIASSGHPRALELFRDVLTASSSVPGMFEPTRITVTANGRQFEELHVDGGVTTNVFILPDAMLAGGARDPEGGKLPGSVYVIMNSRLAPEFEVVQAQFAPTLGRSLSTVLKSHAKNTVLANIAFARSTGLDFNLTQIDKELPKDLQPSFNTDYMRAVYALGYSRGVSGTFWEKTLSSPGRR